MYIGVNNIARKIKGAYVGVDGVARKVKAVYVGDANGKARLVWQSMITKINKFIHTIARSKIDYEVGYNTRSDSVTKGIKINSNTIIAEAGTRNKTSNDFDGCALLKIVVDNNSNITSLTHNDIGYSSISSKCTFGNYLAVVGYSSYSSQNILTCGLFDDYYWGNTTVYGSIPGMYSLNDTQVYGIFNSTYDGGQLFVGTYTGSGNPTFTAVTFNKSATMTGLYRISGNRNLMFYYLNGVYYVVLLTFNSLSSYSMGTPVELNYSNWHALQINSCYTIDDNHVIISSVQGYVLGVYINGNTLSLSNELSTGTTICRIGETTSFYAPSSSSYLADGGNIIYYDTSSNNISIQSVKPSTYSNTSGYEYISSSYYTMVPLGEKGISLFYNGNSNYILSYDLLFDV